MMYDQFQISKNVLERQKELLPLAAGIKGEAVPFNDLKRSVIIAIQTMKQELGKLKNIHDSKFVVAAAVTALHNAEFALKLLV